MSQVGAIHDTTDCPQRGASVRYSTAARTVAARPSTRIACRKQVDWTRVNPLPRSVPARPLLLVVDDEIPVLKVIEPARMSA